MPDLDGPIWNDRGPAPQAPTGPSAQDIYEQLKRARVSGQFQGGPIFSPMGVMPTVIAALGAGGGDPTHYIGGHEVLAGQIPWGAPGKIPQAQLDQWINQRNKLFHATLPENVHEIIQEGRLKPSVYDPTQEIAKAPKLLSEMKQYHRTLPEGSLKDQYAERIKSKENELRSFNNVAGVSVSRVPKAKGEAYGSAPITFELDPSKMPASRPYAEEGYRKTKTNFRTDIPSPGIPNPRFEFENRTYNQPIPTNAITKALIDTQMMGEHFGPQQSDVATIIQRVLEHENIPIEQYPNAQAMHSYRARIGESVKRELLRKAMSGGQ